MSRGLRRRLVLVTAAVLACGTAAAQPQRAADRGEVSRLLSLVSLAYKTKDGQEVKRTHGAAPYAAFLASPKPRLRTVAAWSAFWEVLVSDAVRLNYPIPGSEMPHLKRSVEILTSQRRDAVVGLLKRFPKKDEEGPGGLIGGLMTFQGQSYAYDRLISEAQNLLWDEAEELAGSRAGEGKGDGLAVSVVERGMLLSVVNRSGRPLNHLTVSARVEKWPVSGAGTGTDLVIGSLGGLLGGGKDEDAAKGASTFVNSVEDYYAVRNLPDRVFVHLARLEPGAEISLPIFPPGLPQNYARATAATYNAWSDELTVEKAKITGFDVIIARNAARKAEDEKRRKEFAEKVRRGTFSPPPPPFGINRPRGGRPGMGGSLNRPPQRPAGPSPDRVRLAASKLGEARDLAGRDPIRAEPLFKNVAQNFERTPAGREAKRWLDDYPKLLSDLAEKAPSPEKAVRYHRELVQASTNAPADLKAKSQAFLDDFARPLFAEAERLESRGEKSAARALYARISDQVGSTGAGARAVAKVRELTVKPVR